MLTRPNTTAVLAGLVALAALASVAAAQGDPYADIVTWKLGEQQSRKPMTTIEEEIRGADPGHLAVIEGKLLKALADPRATYGCKQWVCRMLRRMGTEKSVAALAKLLADKRLSHMARFALQDLPSEKAGQALRTALATTRGETRIGVISSLGFRRDRQAVPALARLAGGTHQPTARAAVSTLGRIGGEAAAKTLQGTRVPAALASLKADAILMCADSMLAEGSPASAAVYYRKMAAPGNPTFIRLAAFRGLVLADKEKAVPAILPLMKDKNVELQRAVGKFITEMPGTAVTKSLADRLGTLDPGAQLVVLGALETRADKAAAPAVAKAVESTDADVRIAAVRTLATLGSAEHVDLLTKTAVAEDDVGNAATEALARLSGEGVAQNLIKMLDSPDAAIRAKALEIVTLRKEEAALPAAMKAASDADTKVRTAAYKALGAMAGAGELGQLVQMLVKAATDAERTAIQQSLALAAGRVEGPAGTAPVVAALGKAAGTAKVSLLAVLARVGGDGALKAVQGELASTDAEVKKAAVRALADWKDTQPLPVLLNVARTDASAANQVLALRGYVRLASLDSSRPDEQTVKMLADAMAGAKRSEEKKLILAALPKFACDDALRLAESCQRTPGLVAEARQAVKAVRSALVSTKMKVSAGSNGGAASAAIDGNPVTRWTTGHPMKPGDWFAMDFATTVTLRSIFLDHRPSGNDWPRGWEAYVSQDGQNWGRPVAKGKGNARGTKITLPRPIQTRHLKIVQTGSAKKWHWSIHTTKIDTE